MFDDIVRATFASSAEALASHLNAEFVKSYIQACKNWAENYGRGGSEPEPVAPLALKAEVSFEGYFSLKMIESSVPVSTLKPRDFLPAVYNQDGAVGGKIGRKIVGTVNKFYEAVGSYAVPGEVLVVNGASYIYKRPTPFGGWWEAI